MPLTITRSDVTILGAGEVDGEEQTIIDGSGGSGWAHGIIIAASNVTIGQLGVENFFGDGIRISSGSGNIIEGCTITGNWCGINIQSSSSSNIVRNETWLHSNEAPGVYITGSNYNEISGNTIKDNGEGGETGIEIDNGATYNMIHHNRIYDTVDGYSQDVGINLDSAGDGNEIYQNEIYGHSTSGIRVNNCSPEISKNEIYDNDVGIKLYAGYETTSPTISNNLIYGTGVTVGTSTMSTGIEVGGYDFTASPAIHHNTIDWSVSDGIGISVGGIGSASPDIKYNIITNFAMYGINNDPFNSPVIAYNDVWTSSTGTNYSNCTGGTGSMSSDPRYASYELLSNSPCIDAIPGDTVNEDLEGNPRPQGDAYDMGCYEYAVTTTEPVSPPLLPGTEEKDFRMVSFAVEPDDPACISVFGDEMGGDYDPDNFRIGAYDPTISGYVDCGDGLVIEPGRAYWILARNGVDATVDGILASMSDTEVELFYNATSGDGWNQIACPNDANYSWDDVKVLEYDSEGCIVQGPTAISDLSDDNDMIDKRLWSWESGSYSGATTDMVHGNGYWVKAKKANVFLKFRQDIQVELAQLSNSGIMFAGIFNKAKRWVKKWVFDSQVAIADSGDSPPMPMAALSGSSADSEGSDGGCFIATVAMH